jgi:uncharacterized protein YegP (UPF0339 family)
LIILLDILAIYYLVFVSFYRVTKFVKMIGWLWLGVLITGDVIIVALHPCVLTLLCVMFTIMIMTAILSVVLPSGAVEQVVVRQAQEDSKPKDKDGEKRGSYVIREIDAKKYCFEIYDKQDKLLVRSLDCYKSTADVKQAIELTRESGKIADIEDRTVNWIKEFNHPKFELIKEGKVYFFRLSLDAKAIVFKSPNYQSLQECKKQLDKTVSAVASTAVYLSVEKLTAKEAAQYKDMKAKGVESETASTVAQPIGEIAEDGAIVINAEKKKTLWESYSDLSAAQKTFFNGLRKAAQEKTGVKEYESSSQLSFTLLKNNLMRIRIRRNTVEAVFMLMDAAFKQTDVGDAKLKETKTVLAIENETYYALALETLTKKYNLLLEQKNERESRKKAERQEKAKQQRLAKKAENK